MLFKYIIKNKYTGVIYNKVYSISQIEEAGLKSLFDIENYEIIATLQFTGLTDKNGVKIFEGDKVKQYDSYEHEWFGKRRKPRDREQVQEWVSKKLAECSEIYTTPCGMSWGVLTSKEEFDKYWEEHSKTVY